ncbi:MAG: hypothetical protein FJ318_09200 [SAR202 cluster bacterium]|nr:hypothetical protein [SAR202 cluster bacterium]
MVARPPSKRPRKPAGRPRRRDLPALLLDIHDRLLAAYGPQGWWPGDGPMETIFGAILVQNTSWGGAEKALRNLKAAGALSPQAIRDMPEDELAALIRPSGYFKSKARKLKAMAAHLATHGDDVGRWRERDAKELRAELLGVWGIGPETADDIVLYAAHLPSFVMDAYTVRIVDRLGIQPAKRTYEGYQALFEANLPVDVALWNEYHALLDAHARLTCKKRAPLCGACAVRDVCTEGRRPDSAG